MPDFIDPFHTLKSLKNDQSHFFYSLPEFEKRENCPLQRLPLSIRIMLESLLRNCDGQRVQKEHVRRTCFNGRPLSQVKWMCLS